MPLAVGVIQTSGFPPVLAAADAMVKAGRVTLVHYALAERAEFFVTVRGQTGEVKRAVAAGVEAANKAAPGGMLVSWYIVPNPLENVEAVMDMEFPPEVEPFRQGY
jgi:microcompartment protein CcmL/EutN